MKTRLFTILIGLLNIVYIYPYNCQHDNLYYNIINEKGENILNFIENSSESPFNATDVLTLNNTKSGNYWVKAYIVGQVNGPSISYAEFNAPFSGSSNDDGSVNTYNTNILIAMSADETNSANCVPVQLPTGVLRSGLNLVQNPEMDGQEILIYGSLEKYFGTAGIKSPSYAKVGDKEFGINNNNFYPGSDITSEFYAMITKSPNSYIGLTSIAIPEVIEFSRSDINIKTKVIGIENEAFINCQSLTTISISNNVTSIGDYAFSGCSSLTSITIPNSVTSIGDYAFSGCSSLTSITIPNSVRSIGNFAFNECFSLASITCESETPPTLGISAFYGVSSHIPIYVPCESVDKYEAAMRWNNFTNIQEPLAIYSIQVSTSDSQMGSAQVDKNTICGNSISATANYGYNFVQWNDGVTDNPRTIILTQDTILTAEFAQILSGQCGDNLYWSYQYNTLNISGSGAMYDERPWGLFVAEIQDVVLPNGITHIGDDAFSDCVGLTKISIPASVTSIGKEAFAGCKKLVQINCHPATPPTAESTSFANYNVYLNVPCDCLQIYQLDIVFGSFKYIQCLDRDESNVEDVVLNDNSNIQKLLRDGQFLILRDGKTYSVMGQEM